MSDFSSTTNQERRPQEFVTELPAGHPPVSLSPHSHARGGCPFSAKHEYCPPQEGDIRSPCPALNTLANHGFISRNGQDISAFDLVRGLKAAYKLSTPLACVLSFGGWILIRRYNLLSKITLHDIARHNMVEHNASLVHEDTPVGSDYAPPQIIEEWIKDLCQDARIQQALDEAGIPLSEVKPEDIGRVLGAEPAPRDLSSPSPVADQDHLEVDGQDISMAAPEDGRQPSPTHSHFSEASSSSSNSAGSHGSSFFESRHKRFSTAHTTPANSPTGSHFRTLKSLRGTGAPVLEADMVLSPVDNSSQSEILLPEAPSTSAPAQTQTVPSSSRTPELLVPKFSPRGFRPLLTARGVGRARIRREKLTDTPLDALHAEIARGEMAIMLGMWNVRVLPEPGSGGDSIFPGQGNRLGSAASTEQLSKLKPKFPARVTKSLKKLLVPGSSASAKGKSPSLPASASAPASLEYSEGVPLEWAADWFKYERIPTGWRPDHKQTLRDTVKRSKQIRAFMDDLRKEEAKEADRSICLHEQPPPAAEVTEHHKGSISGALAVASGKLRELAHPRHHDLIDEAERESAARQVRMEEDCVLGLGREF